MLWDAGSLALFTEVPGQMLEVKPWASRPAVAPVSRFNLLYLVAVSRGCALNAMSIRVVGSLAPAKLPLEWRRSPSQKVSLSCSIASRC